MVDITDNDKQILRELNEALEKNRKREEKLAKREAEAKAKQQAQSVIQNLTKNIEEVEKERARMVARLAKLVAQKRRELDVATQRHLKGKALSEESLIVSFVVGGFAGSAGDLDLESKIRPSQIGKSASIMLCVLRINGKIAAVRTGDNPLNPVFLVAEGEAPTVGLLRKKLDHYAKAYVMVTNDVIQEYLRK